MVNVTQDAGIVISHVDVEKVELLGGLLVGPIYVVYQNGTLADPSFHYALVGCPGGVGSNFACYTFYVNETFFNAKQSTEIQTSVSVDYGNFKKRSFVTDRALVISRVRIVRPSHKLTDDLDAEEEVLVPQTKQKHVIVITEGYSNTFMAIVAVVCFSVSMSVLYFFRRN